MTVAVGSQVSGIVDVLYADYNTRVRRGQLLATLDTRLSLAVLQMAEAGLAAAHANEDQARTALADARRVAVRYQALRREGPLAQADVDTAVATRDGNAAALSAAKATVIEAQADRDQARLALQLTRIVSPIDGPPPL